MRRLVCGTSVLVGLLLVPTVATATVDLTAVSTRIANHPSFVRVVVDFTDGRLVAGEIMAEDPDPFADGRVRISVPSRNAQAQAAPLRRAGVTARVLQGRDRVVISAVVVPRRFKYMGYRVLHDDERLVIDLYKSAPPRAGTVARFGRSGCLAISTLSVTANRIGAEGTESGVFEHSFSLRARSAAGGVVGERAVIAAAGRWTANVRHFAARPQIGTLEAVELSAKDGALSCLVQLPVVLGLP